MKKKRPSFVVVAFILILSACGDDKKKEKGFDTASNGTINISVDESFRPVIEAQVAMYEAIYPGTKINASFKTEADCLKDFFRDSATRLVIITRGLSGKEEKFMMDSLGYRPGWNAVAADAIAVIVHADNPDSLFTLDRLQAQLKGKLNRGQKIVFDGLNATSTIRFVQDSILQGGSFDTSVVKGAKSTRDVINYVSNDTNAIGLVGISWIGNPEDTAQLGLLKKVKITYVQCSICPDSPFVKPVQESILSKRYPLVRGLYYAIKENYAGLGNGFVSFLKNEPGQLIFKRAYLAPVMSFSVRDVKLNQKLPER